MEQMVLLGKLSKLDAKVGSRILNCGAFRQELVFVGMTCLQDFESKDPTPITVPLVEKEIINFFSFGKMSYLVNVHDFSPVCVHKIHILARKEVRCRNGWRDQMWYLQT